MAGELTLTEAEINTIYMGLQMLSEDLASALSRPELLPEARMIAVDCLTTAVSACTKLQVATGIKYDPMPEYQEGDEKEFVKPKN